MKRNWYIYPLWLLLSSWLSACGLLGRPAAPSPDVATVYTQVAQTLIAELTQKAPRLTPTPTPLPTTPEPTIILPPSPTPTETPTSTPSATPTLTPGRVIFEDDFEDTTRWFSGDEEGFGFEYDDGRYRIYVDLLNAPIWSVLHRNFADVRLEVDVAPDPDVEQGDFGLVCRHVDEDNYYALLISADGAYGIAKMEDGEFEFLQEGTNQAGIIRHGAEVNRLRADCIGQSLALYANGQKLLEVQDDAFSEGYIGFIVKSRLSPGLEVWFDNFAILETD